MGKFDELEEFFKNNKAGGKPKKVRKPSRNLFEEDDEHEHDHNHDDIPSGETPEEHAGHERKLGEAIMRAIKSGKRSGVIEVRHEHEEDMGNAMVTTAMAMQMKTVINQLNRHQKNLSEIFKKLKVKPFCHDAKGNSLKVNDLVKTSTKPKRVMELGYGYVLLSASGLPNKQDGYWYEEDIIKQGFVKK